MKTLLVVISLLAVALAVPSSALAKKPAAASSPELRIVQVDAVSVTVTVGLSGDEHITYKITDGTKVTLNGAPVFPRDLKAGMVAKIDASPDHSTALTIEAKDAPSHPGKHRVG